MNFWTTKRGRMLEVFTLAFMTIFGIGSQFFQTYLIV